MKKFVALITFLATLLYPSTALTDMFGGDVLVLGQILVTTIQQLSQLRALLSTGQDSLGLIRDINQGINDSLNLLRTVSPNGQPGIYSDWQRAQDALQKLQNIYGIVVPSQQAPMQRDADQSVAEAITRNNSVYDYTNRIDEVGEEIKTYSHMASPGGAQKLTAETLGVMLHVMNESLRTQATGLKLQAQGLAIENSKDKQATRDRVSEANTLKSAMKSEGPRFSIPRF